jgi:hypothetical protein
MEVCGMYSPQKVEAGDFPVPNSAQKESAADAQTSLSSLNRNTANSSPSICKMMEWWMFALAVNKNLSKGLFTNFTGSEKGAMAICFLSRITGELKSPMVFSKLIETPFKNSSAVAFFSGGFSGATGKNSLAGGSAIGVEVAQLGCTAATTAGEDTLFSV